MRNYVDLKRLSKEYLKSYFSINSYIGCTINCGYCFLAPIKIVPMSATKVMDEEELINDMIVDKLFKRDETIISLNNRTDPFITQEVKESTFKLLDIMENLRLKNIVTITTKGLLTEKDAKRLDKYSSIKIVIIVTYNGLPFKIQPIKREIQEVTMKNVSACKNVFLLHQFRPIIPGLNDNEKIIYEIVNYAKKYCDATIYQGVRINEFIKDRLAKRNYIYNGRFDTHKQKPKTTDDIFEKIRNENSNYKVFDHTSCALSCLFNMPDYNMHYSKMKCSKLCKNYNICNNAKFEMPLDITQELKKIGVNLPWKFQNGELIIMGCINDEQKSYIKHILHIKVSSTSRENTYSEKIMEGIE